MINRQDLLELQSITSIPALSILLPTHRTSPDNKQDPILVKNLVDEAKARLSEEYSARELEPLAARLDALVAEIDYTYALDGLALFVSHDFAKKYYLPFSVPSRVVIDQTFATRDLVYGMHREQRYWVILLSQQATRLFAGTGDTLEEVTDKHFPMEMTGPGATAPTPYHADSAYVDDRHRRFFQQVDSALTEYKEDALPIVVGGVIRQISFFQEVSQYTSRIAGTLTGNFDKAASHDIAGPAWEIMQTVRQAQRTNALQEMEQALSAGLVVFTIEEVWQLAQAGRGKLLLVEKNYHVPAILNKDGRFETVAEVGGTFVMDDAVDEIIEAVLAKGGEVAFVDDGALAEQRHIALILRY